jgi:F-type H+-transporting ATPase subunit delta
LSSNSTFSNSTSKSYALALYELSKESSEIDKTEQNMIDLNKLLNTSQEFKEVIFNPIVTKNEKKNIIVKIADQNNFSKTLKNFVAFVADKNRLFFLDKIIEGFLNLVSKNKGELKAKIISSKQLSKEEQKDIENQLSKNFQSPLNIDYRHDPELIAGLIIQVGSIMVDASIKTKLKKLENNMIEA